MERETTQVSDSIQDNSLGADFDGDISNETSLKKWYPYDFPLEGDIQPINISKIIGID